MVTPGKHEVLAGGHVKGGMLASHLQWVNERQPPDQVRRFWNALPLPTRDAISSMILPVNWYEFSDLVTIDRTIDRLFGDGSAGVMQELGAYSARLNLTGLYKAYRRPTVHQFLAAGARLHPRFQDFGDVQYVEISPHEGRMIHTRYSSYSPVYCASAAGYYRESVALHGGLHATVE